MLILYAGVLWSFFVIKAETSGAKTGGSVTSLGRGTEGGLPRVTSSRDGGDTRHRNESLNIFAAEFTRTLDKRSSGKVERV